MSKKPDLSIPTYQAVQFKPWENKRGVAFVSDLAGPLREMREWYKQVWSDACDVGFWVQGNGPEPKLFTLSKHEPSDTQVWTFTSEDGFTIVVYGT